MLALLACTALPAQARVTGFTVVSRTPIAYGYEKIVGKLRFADRPGTEANRSIVDLMLAPRDANGDVESVADVVILAPIVRARTARQSSTFRTAAARRRLRSTAAAFHATPRYPTIWAMGF
jgi:hypothetical protein